MKLLRVQLACELRVLARNGEQLLLILGIPVLLLAFFGNVDILRCWQKHSQFSLSKLCK